MSFQLSSHFSTVRMYTAVFVNSLSDFGLMSCYNVSLVAPLVWEVYNHHSFKLSAF